MSSFLIFLSTVYICMANVKQVLNCFATLTTVSLTAPPRSSFHPFLPYCVNLPTIIHKQVGDDVTCRSNSPHGVISLLEPGPNGELSRWKTKAGSRIRQSCSALFNVCAARWWQFRLHPDFGRKSLGRVPWTFKLVVQDLLVHVWTV